MIRPAVLVAIVLVLAVLAVVVPSFIAPDIDTYQLGHAPTSTDRLPADFGRMVAVIHDRTPPTAPPTTTTTTTRPPSRQATVVRPAAVYAQGALQDMIRAGFARFGPDVAEQAVHVAGCECCGDETGQTLNPAARNGVHAGLLQLSKTYHEERANRLGYTWDQMFEPGPNIAVAADLYAEQQWGPWECRWAA